MLNGPELDLLQEVLAEDPTADIYLDVAHALVEREEWRKAARILRRAFEGGVRDSTAARLLAESASRAGDYTGVSVAVQHIGRDVVANDPSMARSWALALDAQGELEQAGTLARQLMDEQGHDDILAAIVERQTAPPPAPQLSGRDPWLTVDRAEAYLEAGRIDLAQRIYRRIHAHHPEDNCVHARMLRIGSIPRDARPWIDDLSEEYWSSGPMRSLAMPESTLVPGPDLAARSPEEELTVLARRPPVQDASKQFAEEEATILFSAKELPPELRKHRARSSDAPREDTFDDEEDTQAGGPPPAVVAERARARRESSLRGAPARMEEESTEVVRVSAEDIIAEARRMEREASAKKRTE